MKLLSKPFMVATVAIIALVASLAFVAPLYAKAPSCKVWGNTKLFTYHGTTVSHKAGIQLSTASNGKKKVTSWVYVKTSKSVAAKTYSGCARLYNGAGLLIKSSKLIWNAKGKRELSVGVKADRTLGAKYYAGGHVGISDVHIYYDQCAWSPTVTCDLADADPLLNVKQYEANGSGQTYGSLISAESVGETPDLVSVVATDNGKTGYVYSSDLNDLSQITADGNVYIPVYNQDGKTQIGTFELSDPIIS